MSTVADPTAVMGRRIGAAVIDGAVVLVPFFVYQSSQMTSLEQPSDDAAMDYCSRFNDQYESGICVNLGSTVYFETEVDPAPTLVLFGLSIAMYVVLQGITGWTLGKLLTGIRTVRADTGNPAGVGKALVRWLLWIVDALPFLWLVGLITSLTSTGHRRVGDMAAGTNVVRADAVGSPILATGAVPGAVVPGYAPPGGAAPVGPWGTEIAAPTAKPGPQWDEARGTYIQWDPEPREWMQWDDTAKRWEPIQVAPPPPSEPPPAPPPPPPPPPA